MKYTTNFIVYLSSYNTICLAKCRKTGRFVKTSIAQKEFDKEYKYFSNSLLTMVLTFFIITLSNVVNKIGNIMNTQELVLKLAEVLSYFAKGYKVVLFTRSSTYSFKNTVNSEQELKQILNSGLVKGGRIL